MIMWSKPSVPQKNPVVAPLARALSGLCPRRFKTNSKSCLRSIAYFVAKLELPFTTYENLCGLEMKDGVDRAGTRLREFQQFVKEDGTFKEISLTRQPNDVVSFANIRESLLNASKQYMNNRFSNFVQQCLKL